MTWILQIYRKGIFQLFTYVLRIQEFSLNNQISISCSVYHIICQCCLSRWGRHTIANSFQTFSNAFFVENIWISHAIWLNFVLTCPIYNDSSLIQMMAWGRTGDKPLSKPMIVNAGDAYMRHSASMIDITYTLGSSIMNYSTHYSECNWGNRHGHDFCQSWAIFAARMIWLKRIYNSYAFTIYFMFPEKWIRIININDKSTHVISGLNYILQSVNIRKYVLFF